MKISPQMAGILVFLTICYIWVLDGRAEGGKDFGLSALPASDQLYCKNWLDSEIVISKAGEWELSDLITLLSIKTARMHIQYRVLDGRIVNLFLPAEKLQVKQILQKLRESLAAKIQFATDEHPSEGRIGVRLTIEIP